MTDQEIKDGIDLMTLAQVNELVDGHEGLEIDNAIGAGGIPESVFATIKSALSLKTGSELDPPTQGLGTNIIKPTQNPGGSPNG